MNVSPGEIIGFYSPIANKDKYHLCICSTGLFLFVNNPKPPRSYPSDFHVPESDIDLPEPNEHGYSIISCSLVIKKSYGELKVARARPVGSCTEETLKKLLKFVEDHDVLTPEEIDRIVGPLADWI